MAYQLNRRDDDSWKILFSRHAALLAHSDSDIEADERIPLPCGEKDWGYECHDEGVVQDIYHALREIKGGFQVEALWVNNGENPHLPPPYDGHHTYYPERLTYPHELMEKLKKQYEHPPMKSHRNIMENIFIHLNEWLNGPTIASKLGFYIQADTREEFNQVSGFFGDIYDMEKRALEEITERNSLSTFDWSEWDVGIVTAWGKKWVMDDGGGPDYLKFLKRVLAVWLNEMAIWYLELFKELFTEGVKVTSEHTGEEYTFHLSKDSLPYFSPIKWVESEDWKSWGVVNHAQVFGFAEKMKLPFRDPTQKVW